MLVCAGSLRGCIARPGWLRCVDAAPLRSLLASAFLAALPHVFDCRSGAIGVAALWVKETLS